MVEDRGPAWIIEPNRFVLVMVGNNIDEGDRCVYHPSAVDSIYDFLAGRTAKEVLAFGKDSNLQGSELAFVASSLLQ